MGGETPWAGSTLQGARQEQSPASTSSSPCRVALAVGRGMAGPELVSVPCRIATQKCTGWVEAPGSRKGFIVQDSVGVRAEGVSLTPGLGSCEEPLFDHGANPC